MEGLDGGDDPGLAAGPERDFIAVGQIPKEK